MNLPDFLTRDPDGEIHLTGYRIGLYTVVRLHREGWSAERIAREFDFPSLSPELIGRVLAFCGANRAEVDAYVDAYRAALERLEETLPAGPSLEELRRRWQAKGLGPLP